MTGATLGGGFGGKALLIEPLVAAATLVLRRPVRLELTRNEDFRMTNPAPGAILDVRLGATRDGRLRGLEARLRFETGGYAENSIEGIAAILTIGPYRWDAHEVVAYGVETNRVGTGAYRAPGATQATFALEQLIDELAGRLDIDPIELRRRNLVAPDDEMADGTPWGGLGLGECLDRIAAHPLWRDRRRCRTARASVWPSGRGRAGGSRRRPLPSRGRRTGHRRDRVVDISGTMTGFATIAAEGLGIAADEVSVIAADTAAAPRSPMSGGSVITYSTGRAVQRATDALRDKILAYAAQLLEIDVRDLELVAGVVQPKGTPERGLTLAQIGESLDGFTSAFEPLEGHGGTVPPVLAPLTSAHLVHVRVDRETGSVEVARVRHRAGRRSRAQSGHRRGPAPRRRDTGTRLGAPRGDGLRRRRPAPDRDLPRLRAPDGADGAPVRDDHRRGAGTGRPVRGEGDRRGTGVRGGGGRGQRA